MSVFLGVAASKLKESEVVAAFESAVDWVHVSPLRGTPFGALLVGNKADAVPFLVDQRTESRALIPPDENGARILLHACHELLRSRHSLYLCAHWFSGLVVEEPVTAEKHLKVHVNDLLEQFEWEARVVVLP